MEVYKIPAKVTNIYTSRTSCNKINMLEIIWKKLYAYFIKIYMFIGKIFSKQSNLFLLNHK